MINKIKNKLQHKDSKSLISNFFSLAILQGANFILPLLSIPYLVRVLGMELYGLLAFAAAMNAYFMILSDYGFGLTATRDISIHRQSKEKVIEIFSAVMMLKFILMFIGLLILTIVVFSFDMFQENWEIYYLTFGIVLGQVLFPVWFFQGMEKMKYISILNILAKTIFLITIFIFVNKEEDYYLVPLFNSIGFIISGIIALYYIKIEFSISFKWQTMDTLGEYLKDGWHIFISKIALVLYTSSNVFVLGLFSNNTAVGYYSLAEKVINAIAAFGSIVTQVLFPYLSKIWGQNRLDYYKKFSIVLKSIIIGMSTVALIVYFLIPWIIKLLSGSVLSESIYVAQILVVTMIFIPLSAFFTQSFVTQKANYYVTKVAIYTAIINILLVFVLVYLFNIYGLAIAVVCVQIFQVFINNKYFYRLKKYTLSVK